MRRGWTVILAGCLLVGGCSWLRSLTGRGSGGAEPDPLRVDPVSVQQVARYPETVTGRFASLADFEDTPGGERGHAQVGQFSVDPDRPDARVRFVVNVTRTGAGALEATLPPGVQLVFHNPMVRDFTGYRLLSMALYSRALRDDLQVTIVTDGASWTSHRTLIRPGWNNVLIDIRRLVDVPRFDIREVRTVRIAFADAAGPVWFNVDDIMVIDNARAIKPTPPGMSLRKDGLNYRLTLPGRSAPVELRQSDDGLWRLEGLGAAVRLAGPGGQLAASGEDLSLMGGRRVGQVEVLEHNALRIRLANTWYFPTRAGEWASLAVRRLRWEHTLWADGRHVTQVMLNNAGGTPIGSVGIITPAPAAWSGGSIGNRMIQRDFRDGVGRWQFLSSPRDGTDGKLFLDNYLRPGKVEAAIAVAGSWAAGDAGRDGFDETQGCCFLAARAGQCRFTVHPPPGGLLRPAFLIAGPWSGPVHVNSEGMTIGPVVRLADGSALFVLPGRVDRPTAVEVTGTRS